MKIFATGLIAVLLLAFSVAAQTSSSSLAGTVADTTNRIIPGAAVALINESSGEERTALTNEQGDFLFTALTPATYTVRVRANGFRPMERKGNVVVSSTRLSVGT